MNNQYILFLGRIVAEKRVDVLLDAFTRIKNDVPQDLYVAGPVEDERIVAAYRADSRIHFLGARFGAEKAELLRGAYLYVLPSDLEGLSIALLEAMSYGNICLASDIAANKEALGDCGVYFKAGSADDLAEKLKTVCTDYDSYAQYKTLAAERIKNHFEWHIVSDRIISYYEAIAAHKDGKE